MDGPATPADPGRLDPVEAVLAVPCDRCVTDGDDMLGTIGHPCADVGAGRVQYVCVSRVRAAQTPDPDALVRVVDRWYESSKNVGLELMRGAPRLAEMFRAAIPATRVGRPASEGAAQAEPSPTKDAPWDTFCAAHNRHDCDDCHSPKDRP